MMRRIGSALAALSLLALPACGNGQPPSANPGMATMPGPAPLDAAMVTPAFGWVLTPDELLVSDDGGGTFSPVDVPAPAGAVRAAFFVDERSGAVAAAAGGSITVATTTDQGRTWRTKRVTDPAANPAGYSSLSLSFGDESHGAIAARVATSQAFSLATVLVTSDGGRSWAAHPAPEAGVVNVEPGGRIWLAGSALHTSTDHARTWTRSELALSGQPAAVAVTPPAAGTLPATVLASGPAGDRTEVQLLTTNDGGLTWGRPDRVPVRGVAGPGVRLAVANLPGGPVVYDNVAGHAYRRDGTDLRPTGLADGIQSVTFAAGGDHGWALAGHGSCLNGKQDCSYQHHLLATTDGGAAWRTIAQWRRPIP